MPLDARSSDTTTSPGSPLPASLLHIHVKPLSRCYPACSLAHRFCPALLTAIVLHTTTHNFSSFVEVSLALALSCPPQKICSRPALIADITDCLLLPTHLRRTISPLASLFVEASSFIHNVPSRLHPSTSPSRASSTSKPSQSITRRIVSSQLTNYTPDPRTWLSIHSGQISLAVAS